MVERRAKSNRLVYAIFGPDNLKTKSDWLGNDAVVASTGSCRKGNAFSYEDAS